MCSDSLTLLQDRNLTGECSPVQLADLQCGVAMHDKVPLQSVVSQPNPELSHAGVEDFLGFVHVAGQASTPEQGVRFGRI